MKEKKTGKNKLNNAVFSKKARVILELIVLLV